jgi:hypothetical protein
LPRASLRILNTPLIAPPPFYSEINNNNKNMLRQRVAEAIAIIVTIAVAVAIANPL